MYIYIVIVILCNNNNSNIHNSNNNSSNNNNQRRTLLELNSLQVILTFRHDNQLHESVVARPLRPLRAVLLNLKWRHGVIMALGLCKSFAAPNGKFQPNWATMRGWLHPPAARPARRLPWRFTRAGAWRRSGRVTDGIGKHNQLWF